MTYQITATATVSDGEWTRSSQLPTFQVEATSAHHARTIAWYILESKERTLEISAEAV